MLFNSYEFLLFFPIVTVLFWILPHRARWLHLLLASIFFYCSFLPIYVLILFVTIVIDYFAGLLIGNAKTRTTKKVWLITSLLANVLFLCFFKYYDFFITNINALLSTDILSIQSLWISQKIIVWNNILNGFLNCQFNTQLDFLQQLILPIGLSFHTFQAMSYTIEIYRGKQKPEKNFGIYSLYVMFYPQLVAGPIERPQNILPQFYEKKKFSTQNLLTGLRLMMWGLFKKVVIADRLLLYVNPVYENYQDYHWLNLLIATIFFSIQVYCDFSGYSDIAIGAAQTMGYKLMINFKRPQFVTNIKQAWDKWHISLTSWFRDYLYNALKGKSRAFHVRLFSLLTVFLVCGFWHGPNWTFIIWGALHGIFNIIYILWAKWAKGRGIKRDTFWWGFFGWFLTFTATCVAWVFFRSNTATDAANILSNIITFESTRPFLLVLRNEGFGFSSLLIAICTISLMLIVEYKTTPLLTDFNNKPVIDVIFMALMIFIIIVFGVFSSNNFVYFQF